jgi:hypothetical protein
VEGRHIRRRQVSRKKKKQALSFVVLKSANTVKSLLVVRNFTFLGFFSVCGLLRCTIHPFDKGFVLGYLYVGVYGYCDSEFSIKVRWNEAGDAAPPHISGVCVCFARERAYTFSCTHTHMSVSRLSLPRNRLYCESRASYETNLVLPESCINHANTAIWDAI